MCMKRHHQVECHKGLPTQNNNHQKSDYRVTTTLLGVGHKMLEVVGDLLSCKFLVQH
jgi:hypothetical protein